MRHKSSVKTSWLIVGIITVAWSTGAAWADGIDPAAAANYFKEAQAVSARDGGKLWGAKLYGPMMFVDPGSRSIAANQADAEGKLREQDGVFVGTLPATVNIANTATTWAGVHWTMIIWPLPQDRLERACLMAHELWHRVQGGLNIPGGNPANNHLDTPDGRLWLQLEWRALAAALRAEGSDRRRAVADALLFRFYRQSLFEKAGDEERLLELNEGLAEYTGVVVGAANTNEAVERAESILALAPQRLTFVRSFAYATGPALGLLLDAASPSWRKELAVHNDFGKLLASAYSVDRIEKVASQAIIRAAEYDLETLQASEAKRELERQQRLAQYRARLVDGPTLRIALRDMNIQFNPQTLVPLGQAGTVYPTLRITDVWGILTVDNGALLTADWLTVFVSAPQKAANRSVEGDGWILNLEVGWAVRPTDRLGSFELAAE